SVNQRPYGEFKTCASSDPALLEDVAFDSSPFVTALVVHCLDAVSGREADETRSKAIGFLESEMEPPGLWRYWSSRNEKHRSLPPDLDDTCCASYVLRRHETPLPPHRELILANRDSRGVFFTWVVPRSSLDPDLRAVVDRLTDPSALVDLVLSGGVNDIDCVVNANVLLYLGDSEATRAASEYLVDTVLEAKESGCSLYYPDPLTFYYMLSRAYYAGARSLGPAVGPVRDRVRAMRQGDGSYGDAMNTALALCTLLHLGGPRPEMDQAFHSLIREQSEQGSWPRRALYRDQVSYYGSEELTTALCVEALATYLKTL
ncbi:MAG: hypothetical protein ACE5JD_18215, partial [Candidatus Methylomirabilia bacterium]